MRMTGWLSCAIAVAAIGCGGDVGSALSPGADLAIVSGDDLATAAGGDFATAGGGDGGSDLASIASSDGAVDLAGGGGDLASSADLLPPPDLAGTCVAPASCYSGPLGTAGKGACAAGTRYCLNGLLGPCIGEI